MKFSSSSFTKIRYAHWLFRATASEGRLMYGLEDQFEHICGKLGIHWMWWPAIGGIGIGVGGFFFPRGLGIGYDNIAELLRESERRVWFRSLNRRTPANLEADR